MTQSINKPDFNEQLASFGAKKAIDNAFKEGVPVSQLKKSFDAPAVKAVKQGLVPTPKATKTPVKKGKAGRIVGISADENKYIQEVLQMIADDAELGASNPNYVKIQARYNK